MVCVCVSECVFVFKVTYGASVLTRVCVVVLVVGISVGLVALCVCFFCVCVCVCVSSLADTIT